MLKQVLLILLIAFVMCEDICPSKLVEACEKDVQLAYDECDKAAKEKGKDQDADINCLKYLLSSRKDCWPCICDVAKKLGLKIKGCNFIVDLVQRIANLRQ